MLLLIYGPLNSEVIKFDIVHLLVVVCVVSSNVQIVVATALAEKSFLHSSALFLMKKCLNMVEPMVENKQAFVSLLILPAHIYLPALFFFQLMNKITDQDDLNNALAKWNGQGSVKLMLKDSNQKLSGADSVSQKCRICVFVYKFCFLVSIKMTLRFLRNVILTCTHCSFYELFTDCKPCLKDQGCDGGVFSRRLV